MSLDYGPQYHPPELIFWNLLGSKAQVQGSAAGQNCTELGAPTYEAGYTGMGNAVRVDAAAEGISVPLYLQNFNQSAGCVEMWLYNDGWTYTNAVPSANHHAIWGTYLAAGGGQSFHFVLHAAGFYFQHLRNGVNTSWGPGAIAGVTALNQTWHHFGIVWNTVGIGGGANTQRLYFDGALLGSTNAAFTLPIAPDATLYRIGIQPVALANPWVGRIDNIKHWNYDKTDFSDRFTEGYTAPAPAPGYRPPEIIVPKWASLEIGGYTVVDRMSDLPKFREEVSSSADAVFAGTAEIDARNFDGSFSLGNPLSFFAGTNWQGKQVKLYDRWGDLAWDGLLEGVDVDEGSRQTKITSRSRLYRWRDTRVVYAGGAETPAGALENIFAAVGFTDYHDGTLQASIDQQTADGLSIIVTLVDADNVTLAQAVSMLAVYGVADVWEHLGLLYYRYADLSPARSVGTLDADDILGALKISRGTRELVNDYAIYEAGATTVVDATAGNLGNASRLKNGTKSLKTVSASASVQWAVQDVATAQAIGERWISWTNVDPITDPRPRIAVEFDVRSDLRAVLAIGTDFALTYPREGWTAQTWRIVAVERDDEKRRLTIKAVEW